MCGVQDICNDAVCLLYLYPEAMNRSCEPKQHKSYTTGIPSE